MSYINIIKIIVDSNWELKDKLRNSIANNLIIGEVSQIEIDFYAFRIEMKDDMSIVFEVGVISKEHGIQQECKLIDKKHICIGFNKEVHIINSEEFIKHYKVMLDSLFYEFISLERKID